MKNVLRLSVFFAAIVAVCLPVIAGAQRPSLMQRMCDDGSSISLVEIEKSGDILLRPCPDSASVFEKNVAFRKNNSDNYNYGFSFDSLSNYDGVGEATNSYTEFNIDAAAQPQVYRNIFSIFNISTPNNLAAAIGMTGHVFKTGTGNMHDVQGIQGSSIITDGRVSSGIYGIAGNTAVVGGNNHGDIADLRVGASTFSNTSARSYSAIWITRPTMTNTAFTGPVTALRVDDALRSPVFTISPTGQIRITNPVTPANAAAPCNVGEIVWDPDFVYVCVATDTWKRTGLASW